MFFCYLPVLTTKKTHSVNNYQLFNWEIAIYNRVWEVTFCSVKFNLKHDAQRIVS
jgi:hypothetical protein